MIHSSFLPMPLRVFAGLLLFVSFSCNKKLPGELPCGCDTDPAAYKKGNFSQRLSICGTVSLPIDSTLSPSAVVDAFLGAEPSGFYSPLELGPTKTLPFFNSSAIQIKSIGWRFSVDGQIKDLKGNLLVQMMDNKWYVYTNNISKYNYDAKGLEIFDKQGRIAFSIDSKPSAPLLAGVTVQGLIPMADSTVAFYETGLYFSPPLKYGTPELDSIINVHYQFYPIQPLFRYTGPNWQHARVSPGA